MMKQKFSAVVSVLCDVPAIFALIAVSYILFPGAGLHDMSIGQLITAVVCIALFLIVDSARKQE